ncbi:membrane protein [Corynebacterium sphenisci DSM 44792]|uniref:Membrane protein n=1 Tax=Corynebacterium sphenisci DSM 44792 TaxID=1437874 RepID=A0A1L7CZ75_9CORY|nr:Bax inhibitor-1/YccA family protein [Corynebacterium sphenisci]APT91134.1 membrane protein [Corynebacterium sphenisci DSM 44792]
MRQSSNPAFSSLTRTVAGGQAAATRQANPYDGYVEAAPAAPGAPARAMTVDDVVAKTGITLGVIVAGAAITYAISTANPGLGALLAMVGAIGGLIAVLVSTFGRKFGSAAVTLTYAAFEGLFVGGISFMFAGATVGGGDAAALITQAVIATIGVFAGMLFVYKTGAIRVTPKFTRLLTAGLIGVLVLAVGNLLLALFTGSSPLRDGGPLAIVFSLVCIGLAAFSFLLDFDQADRLVRAGAPANYAWGVALGLAVTLVWLYVEILRLLSYFRD